MLLFKASYLCQFHKWETCVPCHKQKGTTAKCMETQTRSERFRHLRLPLEGFVLRPHCGEEGDQRVLEEVKDTGAPD